MKKLFLLLAAIVTLALSSQAQNHTYRGTVLSSADDEPLAGATVKAVGASQGVMTNVDGEFSISVPASVTKVTVSYVGMKDATVSLSDNMKIFLDSDAKMLDQVVVTGYGSAKKLGSVVGSVSVVGDNVMDDTPAANFVDALQGQVAGLSIYSMNGEPSAVPGSIRIRGVNSLEASNTPLFILDGAPTSSSIFNTLPPSEIENVTVLKDASATAIYGSRAANGVIVITTKKGKYGEDARVTIRANVGWSGRADNKVEMMNSQQYLRFREMTGNPLTQDIYDLVNNYGISTDWEKELIKDNALTYSVEGAVQGGSEKTRYYLSVGHYYQDGLVANSDLRRESLRASFDSKVKSWLKIGMTANLGYSKYATNDAADGFYFQNPFSSAYVMLPFDSPYYYSFNGNGDIVYGDRAKYYRYSESIDPNYYTEISLAGRSSRLTANVNLYEQINPIKGLTLKAQQAVTGYDARGEAVRSPQESFTTPMGDFVDLSTITGRTSESFTRYYQFTYTNTAEYQFTINDKHDITLLLGQESIISRQHGFSVASTGQPNNMQWLLTNCTPTIPKNNLKHAIYNTVINSYFLTGSYNFDNRYFFDFSVRRDGSSKFAPDHRWGTFYAVGAMWNIKNEKFLQNVKWLSDLKLRANYGTVGNSGIDPYQYDGTIGTGRPYNGLISWGIDKQSNLDLKWETVEQFDLGIDVSFFDRLRITADYYLKNTKDMLMSIPYSITTGFPSGMANIGSLRNEGVDVEIQGDIYKSRDWYVGARVNFNYNNNTITELFNGLDEYPLPDYNMVYKVGENPNQINCVRYAGVDPRDGQQMWYTKDGNLTKTYNKEADAVNTGKSFYAPWAGGFGIDARWKGLSLRADFTWCAEKYIQNWTNRIISNAATAVGNNYNQRVEMLNVWTKPGDVTQYPNVVDLYGNAQTVQVDSRFIEDASFVRMKNLTIAYQLPKSWLSAMKMQNVTFHFTGRNLLTFTDFTGTDPEYENNAAIFFYPNTRQYEFGVEVTF